MASFMNFRLLFAWVVNFCLLSPGALSASGDGARVHGPAPVGANILVFHASMLADANHSFDPSLVTPNLKFDTSIGILQYARTPEMSGRFVLLGRMLLGGKSTRKLIVCLIGN